MATAVRPQAMNTEGAPMTRPMATAAPPYAEGAPMTRPMATAAPPYTEGAPNGRSMANTARPHPVNTEGAPMVNSFDSTSSKNLA
jgi:hypothetical protein